MDRDNIPNLPSVPYIVYEETMVKFERTIKEGWRLFRHPSTMPIICKINWT